MDQLIIQWNNVEALLRYGISFALGVFAFFGYLKQSGIKLASMEKVLEYRQIKEYVGFIQKYMSVAEVVAIVEYISKESGKAGKLTPEIKETAFEMFINAIKTEEPGK